MGHRHLLNRSQMFEGDQDQSWDHMHMEQPHTNLAARVGPSEIASSAYPVQNITATGVHYTSQWNPLAMPNGYISSGHTIQRSHYQPDFWGSSHDHLLHVSAGTFCPENPYAHHASSSSYDMHRFQPIDVGFLNMTMGSGRGPHKRKSPSSACESSFSVHHAAGTSSDAPLSSDIWLEKSHLDWHYMPWEEHIAMGPNYRGSMSHRAESSARNVRSRQALDLECNLARTQLSQNASHGSHPPSHIMEQSHPSLVIFPGQSPGALANEWNHARTHVHSRVSVSDATSFSHERSPFNVEIGGINSSAGTRGHHHDLKSCGHPIVPQSSHGDSSGFVRGAQNTCCQRSGPSFRISSGSLHLGHAAHSEDNLQLASQTHFSRRPNLLSSAAWHNSNWNGRSGVSHERFMTQSSMGGLLEQLPQEGFMVGDHSAFYGSRRLLDPHRDMRLDVDNMAYEELLALGERIGNVSTGLSEDMISKSLTKIVHLSTQEGGSCAICLEEYAYMDDVGALRVCGHDYHVNCIKKWLSMKNVCPICKASAVADEIKHQ